jgi:ribosome maturation protein SDO1
MRPEEKKIDFKKANQALARLKKQNMTFEIIVNPKLAFTYIQEYRHPSTDENKTIPSIIDILEIDIIYNDASKGERASEDDLMYVFKTTDVIQIAKHILEEGTLQLTQEQRKELAEKKRKQIINWVSKNAIDPKTNLPHPPARIENAMEYGKIRVDPFKSIDEQLKDIVKKLMEYLPIRVEQVKLAVRMPAEYGGKAYGLVKRFGTMEKEDWSSTGNWICVLTLPAGRQADFIDSIEKLTRGKAEIKILERTKL